MNLGPVYRVKPGETLADLAARFRTTVKSLLSLNPDVQPDGPRGLPAGQELCLLLCSR